MFWTKLPLPPFDLVGDDLINWPESDVKEIDPKSLDRRIRKHINPPDKQGIWYASHKVFILGEGSRQA